LTDENCGHRGGEGLGTRADAEYRSLVSASVRSERLRTVSGDMYGTIAPHRSDRHAGNLPVFAHPLNESVDASSSLV
jgi:hypothetical protein